MARDNNPWPLPTAWKWGTIADVAEVASNLTSPSAVQALPHIAPNHIVSGRPRLLPYLTVREDGVTSPKHRFFPGQVLYSKIRPYLRKAVVVDFEGVCSADMYPLNARCDPHYLLWWLLSPDFNSLAMEYQGRTVLPKINQEALYRIPVPIPPKAVQHRIASWLNASFNRSERTREELSRIPRLVVRYRQAILAAAFRGQLTSDDTSRWPLVSLGDVIAGIDAGKNVRCEERPPEPSERGIVKVSSVSWGSFDPSAAKTPRTDVSLDTRSLIKKGDFLISRANTLELVGACVIVGPLANKNLYLSDKVLRIRFTQSIEHWVLHFLRSADGRNQIEALATGNQVSMRNIGQAAIKSILMPLPPENVRTRIIDSVQRALASISTSLREVTRAVELLDRLEQATVARAFRGDLAPSANDVSG